MTIDADMIVSLRRMIAEPTEVNYSDDDLIEMIENNAVTDQYGRSPFLSDFSTTPPTIIPNPDWLPTYDLNRTASEIWEAEAANVADEFDFSADGGDYRRSQKYQQAINMVSLYRSRSMARSVMFKKYPRERVFREPDAGENQYQERPPVFGLLGIPGVQEDGTADRSDR